MAEMKETGALEQMEGVVDSIIFSSTDGRFSVFRLRPERQNGRVNVTVNAAAPLVGQQLKLQGSWIVHPRFGDQFRALHMTVAAPTSAEGIERFLASGAIGGIGPVAARRIVAKFGQDALDIIEKHPGRLQEVEGIGKKTAQKIYESYTAQSELREVMLWLELHGVSGAYGARIYKQYGSFSVDVLEHHPYRLTREVDGIGFTTADAIAKGSGVGADDAGRIAAGLDYALLKISLSGHCCIPELPLIEQTSQLLHVSHEAVRDVLKEQLRLERLAQETMGGMTLVYPEYLYIAERKTAESLRYLKEQAAPLLVDAPSALVGAWEQASGVTLADKQREAVEAALTCGILVLTGGPGTGKTTVVRAMLELLDQQGMEVLLGAPTGRAAKRLTETTGRKAVTVHRLLEAQGGLDRTDGSMFAKDEDEQLEADVIILDEVSMMDIVLMQHFLAAVPAGCHVILVGDADQLPAVGPGSVLKDILRSGAIPCVRLSEVFRQNGESPIVLNAHAINAGRMPDCMPDSEFQFWEIPDADAVAQQIVRLCTELLPQQGFSPRTDIQVLSPMHRQACGVENLNRLLQAAVNPPSPAKPEFRNSTQILRLGDKVMQIRNNYAKNVFNGDIGFIERLEPNLVTVRYTEELTADYEQNELSELQLAYAMSVHKSQGSEYPVILLPLVPGHYIMLQRNLLYTAVTRARERVILLGTRAALQTAVSNDRTKKRYTLLAERLSHSLD